MSTTRSLLPRRLRVLWQRGRNIDIGEVTRRARKTASIHGRNYPLTVIDMLWSAARHRVGFNDYLEFDFAILSRAERATWVTSPRALEFSARYDDPDHVGDFHHKIAFNRRFDAFLGRGWLDVENATTAELSSFLAEHPTVIGKVPVSKSGQGVRRYRAADIPDVAAFRALLLERGELLLEESIVQHDDLSAVCPGTVNTTRVTTFVTDAGAPVIINMAQKFGRGEVSDQAGFGGFYTVLDEDGRAQGSGYNTDGDLFPAHPESGFRIAEFALPHMDAVRDLVQRAALVIPEVRYVGWDVVVTPTGAVLIEGNWGAGVFENKPTATGIRHGHLPRYRAAMGF